jgi:uncharacterized protein (DUF2237 family)
MPTNVLGTELRCCCKTPVTGFYRDGYCRTGPGDVAVAHGLRADDQGVSAILTGQWE